MRMRRRDLARHSVPVIETGCSLATPEPAPTKAGRVWREGGRLVIEYADPRLAESAVNEIRSGRFPPLPNVAVREAQAALAATPEPAPALT